MILYTLQAVMVSGTSEQQLEANIINSIDLANIALEKSKINMYFDMVHLGSVSAGVEQARPHSTWWWCFCVANATYRCFVAFASVEFVEHGDLAPKS